MNQPRLYVRCVVPDFADEDMGKNDYSPWFVAHADDNQLADEVLVSLFQKWLDQLNAEEREDLHINIGEATMAFMDWLEKQPGYQVLHSSSTGSLGWTVLPVETSLAEGSGG